MTKTLAARLRTRLLAGGALCALVGGAGHAAATAVVTGPSGGYQAFPLAPRMAFVTLQANF